MGSKLRLETQIVNDTATILLKGSIDEDADFKELNDLDAKIYEFDFENVDTLNSCGIRGWISFVEKIPDTKKVVYKNCPQIVIEQISMVFGFIKEGALIESFYAPYFCPNCDEEKKDRLLTKNIQNQKAPKMLCEKCNNEMEFDDIETQYFSFLNR